MFPQVDTRKPVGIRSKGAPGLSYVIPRPERVNIFQGDQWMGYLCVMFLDGSPISDQWVQILLRLRDDEASVWREVYYWAAPWGGEIAGLFGQKPYTIIRDVDALKHSNCAQPETWLQ
jgi:hypothetical protein